MKAIRLSQRGSRTPTTALHVDGDDRAQAASNTYSGTLYATRSLWPVGYYLGPGAVRATPVGVGTLTFSDEYNATFTYSITDGSAPVPSQTKVITRQIFGPLPTCIFGALPNLELAANFTGLWWAKPAMSEPGWGIRFRAPGRRALRELVHLRRDRRANVARNDGKERRASILGNTPGRIRRNTLSDDRPRIFRESIRPVEGCRDSGRLGACPLLRRQRRNLLLHDAAPGSWACCWATPITRETFAAPGTVCQ